MERPPLRERKSARLLVLNAAGEVLLFKFLTHLVTPRLHAKGIAHFWATPGGALDPGESFLDAAARELFEETGWRAAVEPRPVLEREFKMQFQDEWVWAVEKYFTVAAPDEALRTTGFTELERQTLSTHAWWSAAALRASSQELIFPEDLAGVVTRLTGRAEP
jgi:8-oxo-dGTP pyrophosphatase MutT (NUDIX family)